MFISSPGASGNTPQNIPRYSFLNYYVYPFAAIQYQTEPTIDSFPNSNSSAIV